LFLQADGAAVPLVGKRYTLNYVRSTKTLIALCVRVKHSTHSQIKTMCEARKQVGAGLKAADTGGRLNNEPAMDAPWAAGAL